MKPRIAILISGGGSNMISLVNAIKYNKINALPAIVISNNSNAAGLDKATELNIPTRYIDHKDSMEGIKRPFDVVLLGLGNDGHFASLFPAQLNIPEAFDAEASPTIIVSDQELGSPSYKRVSMNLSLLTNTKRCILLVPSSEKRKIVETAYTDNQLPLHFLLTQQKIKVEFSDLDF